jgi:peptidyl-tRNA hydrolase, PTH2 family
MREAMALKQVILVRKDLKLPKGKMAAQVAHAALDAALKAEKDIMQEWLKSGAGKIVLSVENERELVRFFGMAKDARLPSSLITDAGHTVVEPGTKTCVGIGPAKTERIDALTGNLKLIS